ncbi:MAG: ABC-F family ATP-binding cassette domain-containing protein [Lachnospiraceae bacterium]|nr:ABC-F family ATP-binding cassette domain-containing protein [Lachnospiraceae bacterium]
MILQCQNITKIFDGKTVLSGVSFHIEAHEKAALIGINGAGKTTLLNIILGKLAPDEGQVTLQKDTTLACLDQHPILDSSRTIYEELLSVKEYLLTMEEEIRALEHQMKEETGDALTQIMNRYATLTASFEAENGYAWRSELTGVLKGLGFTEEDFDQPVNTLSGGQKTRVALGKILLQSPDLILLDEPTNHLDMNAIRWLENYLMNYKGAVLIVSHDRYFLNRISQKVIEIDQSHATTFLGNYNDYAVKKEALRSAQLKAYVNQQREIAHQRQVIDKLKSFNREKSIKRAESREKMLDKIEVLEKPTEANSEMNLTLTPRILSGNDVLTIEELTKRFDDLTLFHEVSMQIKRGEHVAIIGDNGTGKTTLLKMINNLLPADHGSIRLGANVQIGYYDQEHHVLNMEKSIYDEIADDYPMLTTTQIRNVLASFLFTGDDVYRLIKECSGGERGRISLAKLMLSEANFLILDEPTNHLDIDSKEILEEALNRYEGTVLYVSHDRYFINKTAHRILELSNEAFTGYLGNYDYYLEKKEALSPQTTTANASLGSFSKAADHSNSPADAQAAPASVSEQKLDWQAQKELKAKVNKLQNELSKAEKRIEELENRCAEIDDEMAKPDIATNVARLTELTKEQSAAAKELSDLYETWERTSEELSALQ